MQSTEILYYALFAICVSATCAQPVRQSQELLNKPNERRLVRRDAAIFVLDSSPAESAIHSRPKRVYKRISKPKVYAHKNGQNVRDIPNPQNRYRPKKNKSIIGAPAAAVRHSMPRIGPKHLRKGKLPAKKYRPRKKVTTRPPRPTIPDFPFQRPRQQKPSGDEDWSMGFAEPPSESPPYNEVPVDSYGAPLKSSFINSNLPDTDNENHNVENSETGPDYADWHVQTPLDSKFAYSNNNQAFASPSKFEKYQNYDEFYVNSYIPKYNTMPSKIKHQPFKSMKVSVNKPWMRLKMKEEEEKVLVGGQYAEPPGRYVPITDPDEKIIFDNSEMFSPGDNLHVMDVEPTATVSPYVNYKNSNMAFSPQNLNDAFSLDK